MKTLFTTFILFAISILSNGQNSVYEYFESPPYHVKLGTEKNNMWQIGNSKKNFASNSNFFLYEKYIMTDSLKPYRKDNTSSFIISISSVGNYVQLSFNHIMNSDTLKDGGYLEVSYDSEKTWANLATDTVANTKPWMNNHLYSKNDTIKGGIPAFTGNIKSQVSFAFYNLNKYFIKNLSVRFTFKSDKDSSLRAGWAIDNIYLQNIIIEGIDETESLNTRHISIYPHPANEFSVLKINNLGSTAVLSIYNNQGSPIKELSVKDGINYTISDLGLAPGFYTYRLNSPDKIIESGKIVIE